MYIKYQNAKCLKYIFFITSDTCSNFEIILSPHITTIITHASLLIIVHKSIRITSLCDFRHIYSEKKIGARCFFVVMRSLSSSL